MRKSYPQGVEGKAKQPAKGQKGKDATVLKYAMQSEAQKVLSGQTYPRGKKEHSYRVTRCHRHPYDRLHNPGVDVVHYPDNDRYGFGNLLSCGSTWHCPVCSPKITEYRRIELDTAIRKVIAMGGEVAMITLTYPHSIDLSLEASLDKFYKARSKLAASQAFKRIMRDVTALGRVFSTEVTVGQNGWHPHLHMLVLCEKKTDDILPHLERLRDYWANFVRKVGLGEINEHGFDVRNGDYAAEYVAKYGHEPETFTWGASHELAKSAAKVARGENVSPFGLLELLSERAALEIGMRTLAPEEIAGLFLEYAIRFQGRQQLIWSPGLREKLGLETERTDEQIVEDETAREIVGTFTMAEWQHILRLNGRGKVLGLVKRYGPDCLPQLKVMLPTMKVKYPGDDGFSAERRFRGY